MKAKPSLTAVMILTLLLTWPLSAQANPLHDAIIKIDEVRRLIVQGVDVNEKDKYGDTPLHYAAGYGRINVVKLLMEKGANPNAKNENGATPLHHAMYKSGNAETVKELIKGGADVRAKTKIGNTALHLLASRRSPVVTEEIFKVLIKNGANVKAVDKDKDTPLHSAARNGNARLVKLLIQNGADVKAENKYKETPLHKAAQTEQIEVVKLLLQKGANINAKTSRGVTPLATAIWWKKNKMVEFLLSLGANPNTFDKDKKTPLHVAVEKGNTEAVKLLLQKGADTTTKNGWGQSPQDLAMKKGNSKIIKLIGQQGGMTLRESFNRLMKNGIRTPNDRRAAIKMARQIKPPPAIPEEAKKYMAAGSADFEQARSRFGYWQAEEKFQKAVNLAPWWPQPYFNLALAQEKQDNFFWAAYNLEFYLLAYPKAPDAEAVKQQIRKLEYLAKKKREAFRHIQRGKDLDNAGDIQGAIRETQKAIQIYPGSARAHANLGIMYTVKNNCREAIPELEEGVRLGSDFPNTFSSLGYCYNKLGDRKRAITALEKGLRISSSNLVAERAEIHQRLGRYYYWERQYGKALGHLQIALRDGSTKGVDKAWLRKTIGEIKRRLGK